MRVIAKTQVKCGQIMLALLLVMMGFVLNMTPAQAGGDKKGVPTKVVPKPAPPKRPAEPPRAVKTPPTQTVTCDWEDVPMETVVTPSHQYFTPGFVVDPYCGPTVTLSPLVSTVPGSVIQTTGQNLNCR